MNLEKFEKWYSKKYKLLIIIPIIITIIALGLIIGKYSTTGDIINKDVTLRGGITATVYTEQEINILQLKSAIPVESNIRTLTDFTSRQNLGVIIEASDIEPDELEPILEKELNLKLTQENYSLEQTGPKLGDAFYKQLILAILFAFILMGITVLIAYRALIPSLAVIFAAFADITITLAIINLMGWEISTAGIVAFLLVIGYSIDTDILLTTRMLKHKEDTLIERMFSSMKTGLTMTCTTLSVLIVTLIFTSSVVIREMFIIILIALLIDVFTTYFTNTGILYWYAKKKNIN